jgi:hypothetical protein
MSADDIERIARDYAGNNYDLLTDASKARWTRQEYIDGTWSQYSKDVRAILRLVRQPTEAMENAAELAARVATVNTDAEFVHRHESPKAVWPAFIRPSVLWEAMIDVLLSETSLE